MVAAQTACELNARLGGSRVVRIWLLAVAALVFVMVSIGGATRLTGSGLSITEWQPIVGTLPPLSQAQWQDAFAKYQKIPQYERVNKGMDLAGFKRIFWWEWLHRFLGRLIGVAFCVPLLVLLAARRVRRALLAKLAAILTLGGLQGAIGWYMVRSGLETRIDVSQYRLALHLALAMVILGALIWVALAPDEPGQVRTGERAPATRWAALIVGLIFLQVVLGALVAGLRAGLAYNTWPLMDGHLVPSGLGAIEPWYLNPFENALTVQFDHRLLAYVLAVAVLLHANSVVRAQQVPASAKYSVLALALAIILQATLGIATLLAQVPLPLALAHQAGAAAVFGVAVWHLVVLRYAAWRQEP
jgi:cytochrome c oxidase assembly protein subunit 15